MFWRHYVYIHRSKLTNKVFYVGKGTVHKRSKAVSYSRANDTQHRNDYWLKTFNKHGLDVEIVASFKADKYAQQFEIDLISFYGKNNLTNMTDGGEGICGLPVSDKLRNKRSQNAAKPRSQAWIDSIRHSRRLTGNNGVVKLGDKLPQWWKDRISNSVKGKNNPMYGKTGKDHPTAKQIINIESGEIYNSIKEAAEAVGMNYKTLCNHIYPNKRENKTSLRFV